MSKFLFKWFIEVPAAMHTWIQFLVWILAGGNFVYMASKGVEAHILIAMSLFGVGGAAFIANSLPPLLQRISMREEYIKVALILEELAAVGHATIPAGSAAEAWAEIAKDDKGSIRRHLKLRTIKGWLTDQKIGVVALNGNSVNLKTTLQTSDLAEYFRRGCP